VNRKDLYNSFNEIDDDILERSETAFTKSVPSRKRLLISILAALLALLLMGAGVAAIYADSIQNWFGYYWEAVTGHSMSENQEALIDHLTQDINVSQTVGEVTVTIDSATVGDDCFFTLIKVDGLELSKKEGYHFKDILWEITPDPVAEDGGFGGLGFQYLGLDGNGSALFMLDHSYASYNGFERDDSPLYVSLELSNFMLSPTNEDKNILQEGSWRFNFEIDRSLQPQVITLPDTEVKVRALNTQEDITITLTSIEITSTGIRFCYGYAEESRTLVSRIQAVMKNGSTINHNGGHGVVVKNENLMSYTYQWSVPIDLEELAAIQFDGTTIPIK
jgi:hypothetical protein